MNSPLPACDPARANSPWRLPAGNAATGCAAIVPAMAGAEARVALLGVGTVGTALLHRWSRHAAALPPLVHVANSRACFRADAAASAQLAQAQAFAPGEDGLARVEDALGTAATRIVVDATASERVAAMHPQWLRAGIHVVTACKLARGGSLARWRDIESACAAGGARYGDSATVGAGLPLLRSLRALQAGGDRITGIAGVLSGSLAWLFHHYDGLRPFSRFVREAREAGYTEPDPREDLSGEDVRRKLLILARAAGFALEASQIEVESLVSDVLAAAPAADVDRLLELLDAPLRQRFADAWRNGERLRFVARLETDGASLRARVGLESLPPDDPLAGGGGTDNRVAIHCDRYCERPLVIQGPGAGAGVTAAALIDDVLAIARQPGVRRDAGAAGASAPGAV